MNVLVLGSGGREHAIAWKIAQSKSCDQLYLAPGNAGTSQIAKNIALSPTDFEAVGDFCLENKVNLVLVGPEDPLVAGIVDYFLEREELRQIAIIGPDARAAQLEGSKEYCKQFMQRHNIPTAAYQSFTAEELEAGKAFLETISGPYVLKADGLAAGKGVLILSDLEEAKKSLTEMLEGKFGAASKRVLIEEFLEGIEFSVFALTDGTSYKILPVAKDYKRIGEGDSGLNTGGMGAISPVSFADAEIMAQVERDIVRPTIAGFGIEDMHYIGFVFFGLIKTTAGVKVIEYNVRMGDPETEVVMPLLDSDLLALLDASWKKQLHQVNLQIKPGYATTVMAVSSGYPEAYEKGKPIRGLEAESESLVFHAGTAYKEGAVVTNGGRVLCCTSFGNSKEEALQKSYARLSEIEFDGMYYRSDIGFDLD